MKPYIDALKAYWAEYPPFWGERGEPAILDFLRCGYLEFNPIGSEGIGAAFRAMEQEFADVPPERRDELLVRAADLSLSYEVEAFRSGFCLGVCLMRELGEL